MKRRFLPGPKAGVSTPVTQQWARLDAEFEAWTPAEAMRAASRQLGGGLLRLLRSLLPAADLLTPWAQCGRPAPHHPLVLGAGLSLAGGTPELAGRAAALAACASPASAAVRLLGLDPFAVQAMLARLAPRHRRVRPPTGLPPLIYWPTSISPRRRVWRLTAAPRCGGAS